MKTCVKCMVALLFFLISFLTLQGVVFAEEIITYEYEAESGVLSGTYTTVFNNAKFSSGKGVKHLRYGGECKITTNDLQAGFYELELYYAAGETDTDIQVTINEAHSKVLYDEFGGLGWDVIKITEPVLVYFAEGENTISFSKAGSKTFDIDKVSLRYVGYPSYVEEAENGEISGPYTTTSYVAQASNKYVVKHLRYGGSCDMSFDLPMDGYYSIKVYYATAEDNSDLLIHIQNEYTNTVSVDNTGDWKNIGVVTLENIYISQGEKTLSLSKAGDRTPDIDKVEIILTSNSNNLLQISSLSCNTVGSVDRLSWNPPEYGEELLYDVYLDGICIATTKANLYACDAKEGSRKYTVISRTSVGNLKSSPQFISENTINDVANVINGVFETESENESVPGWEKNTEVKGEISSVSIYTEVDGNKCLKLAGTKDCMFQQCVTGLIPNETYVLRGRVKVNSINDTGTTNGVGPSIALILTNGNTSKWIYGKNLNKSFPADYTVNSGWIEQEIEFVAPESGEVYVGCSLGNYWSSFSGEFLFDDIEIQQRVSNIVETENIKFYFTNEDIVNQSAGEINYFVGELDKAYVLYTQLIGNRHNGEKAVVIFTEEDLNYWGLTNNGLNVIEWNNDYVEEEFAAVLEGGFSFGLFHEISHIFDIRDWAWNIELSANFKMLYVIHEMEKENPDVYNYRNVINTRYKARYDLDYTATSPNVNDALTYLLSQVADTVGWDVFEQVYRRYFSDDIYVNGTTNKLDKFIELIEEEAQEKTGFENYQITDTISSSDLQIAYDYYELNG